MKRRGFLLIDLLLGLGLLGLLATSVHTAMVFSTKSMVVIERNEAVLDHCQRIVETLKVKYDENENLFTQLSLSGEYQDYNCSKLPDTMEASIRLQNETETLQTYSVVVRREGYHAELVATRVRP